MDRKHLLGFSEKLTFAHVVLINLEVWIIYLVYFMPKNNNTPDEEKKTSVPVIVL